MNINYDEMLANCNKNLETNLRGFKGGPAPFEEWCPYEGDHDKSIQDLMDIAKKAGNEVVAIFTQHGGVTLYQSERAVQAKKVLNEIAEKMGRLIVVNVVGLKKNVLTIDYEEPLGAQPFHEMLIKIEAKLNEIMNEKFDIQTLNIDDKNRRKCAKH